MSFIGILRSLSGRIRAVDDCVGQKVICVEEQFTRPMPGLTDDESLLGIDRSFVARRQFNLTRDDRSENGKHHIYYYDEILPAHTPPEMLSRRLQELENEWTRLSLLIDELRKKESA